MRAKDYRDAMDVLPLPEGMEERLRAAVESRRTAPRHFRRLGAALIAAAVVLAVTLGTALAASESFRAAVFSFFRLGTAEEVPVCLETTEEGDAVWLGSRTLEDAVTVDYLRIGENCDYENGILCCWQDEARMEPAFYAAADEGLVALPARHLETEVTWEGETFSIDLQWAVWEDALRVQAFGKEPGNDSFWDVSYLDGRTDAVLLRLSRGRGEDYGERALLLELESGEVTDLFAGTGAERLTDVVEITLNRSLTRAILACEQGEQLYLCDLEGGTLQTIEEALGSRVDGAWFVSDTQLGWYTMDGDYRYTCYVTDLSAGTTVLRFAGCPAYQRLQEQGVVFLGGRYVLEVGEDRSTAVLDLLTGNRTAIQGFCYPEGDSRTRINAGEDKILFLTMEMDSEGLGISELTVLDLRRGTAVGLGRTGYDVRHEVSVSWFDSERVVIRSVEEGGTQLLALYRFGS